MKSLKKVLIAGLFCSFSNIQLEMEYFFKNRKSQTSKFEVTYLLYINKKNK